MTSATFQTLQTTIIMIITIVTGTIINKIMYDKNNSYLHRETNLKLQKYNQFISVPFSVYTLIIFVTNLLSIHSITEYMVNPYNQAMSLKFVNILSSGSYLVGLLIWILYMSSVYHLYQRPTDDDTYKALKMLNVMYGVITLAMIALYVYISIHNSQNPIEFNLL